jgi:hypothetical protein
VTQVAINPHEFKAANAPVTDSLATCLVCGLPARLCRLTYRPRGKYSSLKPGGTEVNYMNRGG